VGRLWIEEFGDHEVQTWMAFINALGTELSDSVYTGKLRECGDWSEPEF
jgi:hypothetical protein